MPILLKASLSDVTGDGVVDPSDYQEWLDFSIAIQTYIKKLMVWNGDPATKPEAPTITISLNVTA